MYFSSLYSSLHCSVQWVTEDFHNLKATSVLGRHFFLGEIQKSAIIRKGGGKNSVPLWVSKASFITTLDHPEGAPSHSWAGTKGRRGCGAGLAAVGFIPHTFYWGENKVGQDNLFSCRNLHEHLKPALVSLDWKEDAHPEMTLLCLLCCSWKPLSQLCSERTWPHFKRIIIKSFWDLIQTNDSTCSACYMQCWVTVIKPVCYVLSALSWMDFKKVKKAKSPDPFFFHTWSFMRLSSTQHHSDFFPWFTLRHRIWM